MNSPKTSHIVILFRFGLALFMLCFNGFSSFAQTFEFTNGRKQQRLMFDLVKNLIIVPIYINEKGPFNFILDTGVNPMIVIDTTLKESLKVSYPRTIKISGYGNFDGYEAYLGSTRVKIGDAEIENMPSVFLKDDVLPLSGFLGKKIHGLLGYNFFSSFLVNINYNSRVLKFTSYQKKGGHIKGEKIPLELIENKPYIALQLTQDNMPSTTTIKTLVDCGASHAISLEAWQNQHFPLPKYTAEANLGVGLTAKIQGKVGRVDELKIGSFIFKEVLAHYPLYNIDSIYNKGRNGNIGAEILCRFNTTYDYRNGYLYIKKNSHFSRSFEYDMSGIEFYAEEGPPSRTLISRVEPESPAELAGLKEGDEITAINFKKTDDYSLDEVANIFKAKNGYSVIIEIWRDKAYMVKLIRLKKRI